MKLMADILLLLNNRVLVPIKALVNASIIYIFATIGGVGVK